MFLSNTPINVNDLFAQTKPVSFLEGILAWEQGRGVVIDLRLRAILDGLKRYVEEFKMAWSFRKRLQPMVQSKVETLTNCLKLLRLKIRSHPQLEFPIATDRRPPPIDVCIPAVLEKFMYIIQYLGRVPYPPMIDTKFGTAMSGTRTVWHPNLSVVLSSLIFTIREDVGVLNNLNFQCALHLTIWILGMAGEAPFKGDKVNELFVWEIVTALLNLEYDGCRTDVEYQFG
jgi:hypothetical protein